MSVCSVSGADCRWRKRDDSLRQAGGHSLDPRVRALVYRYTNDDTETSVDLNISGPGKQTEGTDGLIHVDGTGPWSLVFFPGDSPSSTALYFKGHLHFTVDPSDGTLTLVSHTDTVENICDMLD